MTIVYHSLLPTTTSYDYFRGRIGGRVGVDNVQERSDRKRG
jgi:hypothetical protein